jgi:hypothetical protein
MLLFSSIVILWCYCSVIFCRIIDLFCYRSVLLCLYCSLRLLLYSPVLLSYLILSYLTVCPYFFVVLFCCCSSALFFSAPVGSQTTGSTLAILPTVHLPVALCAAPTVASTHTATAISAPFSLTTWSAANHPATPTFIPSPSSHPLLPLPNHIISQLSRN